jgi:hypothetical protein
MQLFGAIVAIVFLSNFGTSKLSHTAFEQQISFVTVLFAIVH